MPARHYNLEYSTNDGGSWAPAPGHADEIPGPGKTLELAGLAPATYSVKLRLVPTTGDPTPIVSEAVILNLGNAPIQEPVQTSAESVVTLADLIIRRDNLLAAAGVEISAADLLVMNEALLSSATAADSVVDSQTSGFQEPVTSAADVVATVANVQTMLEQVMAAAAAAATVTDGQVYHDNVSATGTAADSVTDTYTPGAAGPVSFTFEWTIGNTPTFSTGAQTSPYTVSALSFTADVRAGGGGGFDGNDASPGGTSYVNSNGGTPTSPYIAAGGGTSGSGVPGVAFGGATASQGYALGCSSVTNYPNGGGAGGEGSEGNGSNGGRSVATINVAGTYSCLAGGGGAGDNSNGGEGSINITINT